MSACAPCCLLVTDQPGEAQFVTGLLESDFLPLAAVEPGEAMVTTFEEHRPRFVILSFREIEGAERALLDLYRNSLRVNAIDHRTVLLCQAAAAATAYTLSRRGIFDDYVVTKPLYDPHRLNLTLAKAAAEMAGRRDGAAVKELRSIQRELPHFYGAIRESADSGVALQRDTASTFLRLSTSLRQRRQTFLETDLAPAGTAGAAQAPADLVGRFAREHLGDELDSAQSYIERSWQVLTGSLQAQCESHDSALARLESAAVHHQPLVVIVEDNEFDASVISTLLDRAGFETKVASTAMAGLALVAHRTPDLVVLDFELPELSGLDVLRRLRGAAATAEMPVIFVTGHSEKDMVSECISLGVKDFLVKPVQKAVLLEKVQNIMAGAGGSSR